MALVFGKDSPERRLGGTDDLAIFEESVKTEAELVEGDIELGLLSR